jgi:hypothetical protein
VSGGSVASASGSRPLPLADSCITSLRPNSLVCEPSNNAQVEDVLRPAATSAGSRSAIAATGVSTSW